MNNNIVFSSGIVYKLGFLRFFLFALLFYPVLWYNLNLYIVISAILFFIALLLVRFFRFYETHLEISFLLKFIVKKILYEDIESVIYKYGQYGGMSVIIIKPKSSGWNFFLYSFFVNRFVLENRQKVVYLLKFLKTKKIDVLISSDSNSKQNIINQLKG